MLYYRAHTVSYFLTQNYVVRSIPIAMYTFHLSLLMAWKYSVECSTASCLTRLFPTSPSTNNASTFWYASFYRGMWTFPWNYTPRSRITRSKDMHVSKLTKYNQDSHQQFHEALCISISPPNLVSSSFLIFAKLIDVVIFHCGFILHY